MRRKIIAILIVVLVLLGSIFLYIEITKSNHKFQVTFFNIGQGDAALIQFNDGKKMLVDCGPDRKILAKLGRALPFYDRSIDYLLATHSDLDHYGGCVDVLKNYRIKEIIINARKKEHDPYWREWDRAVKEEGATIKIISRPEERVIAGSTLQFFSPDDSLALDVAAADSNNYSIVFRLKNERTTFLFTGDMEEPLEKSLAHKYCSTTSSPCPFLQADVLKVGHHGSDSSSGEDFLRLIKPRTAIISAGKNRYGHPSLRVLKKLERAGAEILRTDELGDIVIK